MIWNLILSAVLEQKGVLRGMQYIIQSELGEEDHISKAYGVGNFQKKNISSRTYSIRFYVVILRFFNNNQELSSEMLVRVW